MNPPKCNEYDYISFLTATPRTYSCTEAERVQPDSGNRPSHDSINRLPHRIPANAASLREEPLQFVKQTDGVLIPDDSAPDKPYAQKIELVTRHWSGKHHRVVNGIDPVSLLWTDGDAHIPCDFRIYHKTGDGKRGYFSNTLCIAYLSGIKQIP